jgi:hypothetical protein
MSTETKVSFRIDDYVLVNGDPNLSGKILHLGENDAEIDQPQYMRTQWYPYSSLSHDTVATERHRRALAAARASELDAAFPRSRGDRPEGQEPRHSSIKHIRGNPWCKQTCGEDFVVPKVGAIVEWNNGQADQAPTLGKVLSTTDEASLVALQSGFTLRIMNTHLKEI